MKAIFVSFLGVLFLLFSCSEEKSVPFLKKREKHRSFIINLQHYFSDDEFNVSFPIWFNDSLIRMHNIETITRSIYVSGKEYDADIEFDSDSPKEIKTYHFNKDGELLINVAKKLPDLKFLVISKLTEFNNINVPNIEVIDGSWDGDLITDEELKVIYKESTLSIIPLILPFNAFLSNSR